MKPVLLLLLTEVRYGGWLTAAEHMVHHIRAAGQDCWAVRPGRKRTVSPWCIARPLDDLLALANSERTIVACAQKSKFREAAVDLALRGVPFVIHDPTEHDPPLMQALRTGRPRVLVFRETNLRSLADQGIESAFVPMPYVRQWADLPAERDRPLRAVSISRLDWDKHLDLVVEANRGRPLASRVRIYGDGSNRMYAYHKLKPIDERWSVAYFGRFKAEENPVVRARLMVDLSAIAGDGCGSQYTFLEAQDAGAVPVLNKDWFKLGVDDPTAPSHGYVVATADDLGALLDNPPTEADLARRRTQGYTLLGQHLGRGRDYLGALGVCTS